MTCNRDRSFFRQHVDMCQVLDISCSTKLGMHPADGWSLIDVRTVRKRVSNKILIIKNYSFIHPNGLRNDTNRIAVNSAGRSSWEASSWRYVTWKVLFSHQVAVCNVNCVHLASLSEIWYRDVPCQGFIYKFMTHWLSKLLPGMCTCTHIVTKHLYIELFI